MVNQASGFFGAVVNLHQEWSDNNGGSPSTLFIKKIYAENLTVLTDSFPKNIFKLLQCSSEILVRNAPDCHFK